MLVFRSRCLGFHTQRVAVQTTNKMIPNNTKITKEPILLAQSNTEVEPTALI